MLFLMNSAERKPQMAEKKKLLVFTPTPNEYEGICRHIADAAYRSFEVKVTECGPGKINAAFHVSSEAAALAAGGEKPAFIISAGTSGSLSLGLAGGDVIASNSAVISDWKLEDDEGRRHGPYAEIAYNDLDATLAARMTMTCAHPAVSALMGRLADGGLKNGSMLTSDTFVAGAVTKLALGRDFNCLACDMESGAIAYVAGEKLGIPWFNLRVVADTLDESLHDYFNKEVDMVNILGAQTALALNILDEIILSA